MPMPLITDVPRRYRGKMAEERSAASHRAIQYNGLRQRLQSASAEPRVASHERRAATTMFQSATLFQVYEGSEDPCGLAYFNPWRSAAVHHRTQRRVSHSSACGTRHGAGWFLPVLRIAPRWSANRMNTDRLAAAMPAAAFAHDIRLVFAPVNVAVSLRLRGAATRHVLTRLPKMCHRVMLWWQTTGCRCNSPGAHYTQLYS